LRKKKATLKQFTSLGWYKEEERLGAPQKGGKGGKKKAKGSRETLPQTFEWEKTGRRAERSHVGTHEDPLHPDGSLLVYINSPTLNALGNMKKSTRARDRRTWEQVLTRKKLKNHEGKLFCTASKDSSQAQPVSG